MKQSARQTMPSLSRRTFVTAAAATGAAAAVGLSGCAPKAEDKPAEQGPAAGEDPFADCELVYGCCSPECQHHLLKGYVRDGKLVKVESGEVNECPACGKGFARVEMCNSDKRLTKPLKLVGAKGSGEFEEISWDEAIDLIEEKINYALDNGGSQSIIVQGGSGNFSSLNGAMGTLGSWLGGTTPTSGNMCCAGIDAGVSTILGTRSQPTRNEFENSDYIIAWGNNPVVTLCGYFGRIQKMMDNGGTLCTIDPFYSETADKSQEWIQPWPGTDSALALAMLKVVIDEGLTDEEYLIAHTTAPCLVDNATGAPAFADPADDTTYQVWDTTTNAVVAHDAAGATPALSVAGTEAAAQYTTIYDLIKAEADKWGKEAVEAETGCSFDDVARIARDYATAEHAMIIQNMGGYQRTENGAYATATQVYLALFTGNVGHTGDGVYDVGGVSSLTEVGSAYESNPDAQKYPSIPFSQFGEMVLADQPTKINFMWIANGNIASQWPNSNMVKKALEHIPFVVKVDHFMNATGLWADLVLPCTALFETPNVTASSRSAVLEISEAGVTPPGEAKTDLEITLEVAKRFGFEQYFNEDPRCTSSACWNPPASRTTSWWKRRASTCGSATRAGSPTRTASSSRPPARHICGCRNGSTKGSRPSPATSALPNTRSTPKAWRRSTRWPPCSASCARRCTPSSRTWTRCWTWTATNPTSTCIRRTPRRAASSTATRWRPTTTAASMRARRSSPTT